MFPSIKPDTTLSEIPIDAIHSTDDFSWRIENQPLDPTQPTIPTPYPPSPPFILVILEYIVSLLPYWIIISLVIVFVIIKYSTKKDKEILSKQIIIEQNEPSAKYGKQEAQYYPQKVYRVQMPIDDDSQFELKTEQSKNITCAICYQKITDHDKIIRCPSCDVAFHKNHLLQWVFDHQTCPVCKAKLRYSSQV